MLATAATFLRNCAAQALSRGDGPCHSLQLHALAKNCENNDDLILLCSDQTTSYLKTWSLQFHCLACMMHLLVVLSSGQNFTCSTDVTIRATYVRVGFHQASFNNLRTSCYSSENKAILDAYCELKFLF